MGVRLSAEERETFLQNGHTGIITTLRRDGSPVSLPVWYAYLDGKVYVGSPESAAKVKRIRHDDRAWFLVESGEKWKELAAVGFPARATVVEGAEADRAMAAYEEKYAEFRTPPEEMPGAAQNHYAKTVMLRLDPTGDALTWNNAKIRLKSPVS
ncbi:pyridoxamine 5'-phosphate oxidase family protein [Georgenia sp. SYP-B2076]|uniref:pyridoxamine 5'-phosphate oxidase family protein n=1 Tax=Georgenia sp. SYP-B2076 TaxID=2495881 RepID=UPI000F8E97DC|nr:pyridoxamine 5'-phosphate oxidase family protein [Georgenia sp. SYP-B2076]